MSKVGFMRKDKEKPSITKIILRSKRKGNRRREIEGYKWQNVNKK